MTSRKAVFVIVGVGACVANLVAGCTGRLDGFAFDVVVDDGGNGTRLPEAGPSPDPSNDEPDASYDAGDPLPPKDGGSDGADSGYEIVDAGRDSDVDTPTGDAGAPGTPCPTKDSIQHQPCGLCGVQYRLCGPNDPNDTTGDLLWQPWGYCQEEVEDGCAPGTDTTEGCGLCGTRRKVCQSDCHWAVSACKGEPPNACSPGNEEYQPGLSCLEGGRMRTCQANCTFDSFGECFVPGEPAITLSPTAGAKVSEEFELDPEVVLPRLSGSCPSASTNNSNTSYMYVALVNPTESSLVVTVWSGKASASDASDFDTVMASYSRNTIPAAGQRSACGKGVVDDCPGDDGAAGDPESCVGAWAALFDDNVVTVPPNDKVYIYIGGYSSSAVGAFKLTARTDSVD